MSCKRRFLYKITNAKQEIKTSAKLETNTIIIGQQVKLELSVQYRVDNGKQVLITWPEIIDTLRKEVEVVSQTKIDTLVNKADPYLFTQSKTFLYSSRFFIQLIIISYAAITSLHEL